MMLMLVLRQLMVKQARRACVFCLMGVLMRPGLQSKSSEMVRGTNYLKNKMK